MMPNLKAYQTGLARIAGSTLLTNTVNILGLLIIFFASTQLGLHFWLPSSLIYGIRIDYLAPTLYFLDCLILLYLTLFARTRQLNRSTLTNSMFPLVLVGLIYSANPLASLVWSLRFFLYSLFLVSFIKTQLKSNFIRLTVLVLSWALAFQVVLSLLQVYFGQSLGGLLYWLGERNVAVGQPSVALGSFMGQVILRAYGTFSHPNILSGWLIVAALIIYRLKPRLNSWQTFGLVGTVSLGLLLSASRAGTFTFFVFIIPFYFLAHIKTRLLYFLVLLPLFFSLTFFTPSRAALSQSERRSLSSASAQIIRSSPVFGAGINASLSLYPVVVPHLRLLQPDHNVPTLALSWLGFFGMMGFLLTLRGYLFKLLRYLLPLTPLLLFDHYFLTAPPTLFILLFYLFLSFTSPRYQLN
jgi:hypothetical protein